jgi:hypothetical protein
MMENATSRPNTQLQDLLVVFLRTLWAIPLCLGLGLLVALAVTLLWRMPASFESEALLAVRTPGQFEVQYAEHNVHMSQTTRRDDGPSFLPAPLNAYEVAELAMSAAVLAKTAAAVKDGAGRAYSVEDLRSVLSASSRLELKTPLEVRYSSVVTLRATAPTPEQARLLCGAWAEATAGYVREMYAREREHVFVRLDQIYEDMRAEAAQGFDSPVVEVEQALLRTVAALRLQAQLARDAHVGDLAILSGAGDGAPVKHHRLEIFLLWLLGTSVVAYVLVVFVRLLLDARDTLLAQ